MKDSSIRTELLRDKVGGFGWEYDVILNVAVYSKFLNEDPSV